MINIKILAFSLLVFIIFLGVALWYFFHEEKEINSFILEIPISNLYLHCETGNDSQERETIEVTKIELVLKNYNPWFQDNFSNYQSSIIAQSRDLLNIPKHFSSHRVIHSNEEPTIRGFVRYLYSEFRKSKITERILSVRIHCPEFIYVHRWR